MDLYPIKSKDYVPFNGWKWFSIALVIVAIFLLYRSCNQKPLPALPVVIPVAEQKENVRVDSVASKKVYDSFMVAIKEKDKAIETWYNEWKASETRYNDLEKGFVDLTSKEVPDTCKEMKQAYILQLNKLISESRKKDYSCGNTIASLKAQSAQKDLLIKKGQDDWKKLKVNFDTALAQQTKLTKAVSSLKPNREFYLGITGQSEYNNLNNASVGITADYKTKKGTMFGVAYFNTQQVQLSYKKRLFKF